MKKLLFTLLFIGAATFSSMAQEVISSSSGNSYVGSFSNEVKLNFLNAIALGSIEFGYERYLSDDHSLDIQLLINDRFGFNNENNGKKYKTNSVQASMNFYFGDGKTTAGPKGRFYIYPLVKLRFGDFEEEIDGAVETTNMNAFMFGAGGGYKWEISDHFAFGPYASVTRGFSNEVADRFSRIEVNGGFSLGYRF
ncbi:DUF3575 domain-containing protein [Algoriphagus zhangzhouensis]|uniref:Outer membrane protein beta-barrel domain-containing protein n=1 Tax=Algoriphagus zhangzhouensis TaxID=1073327 RepID=A0A1M7ZIQ4_9BACT|nr:DUF3575 domain-containing protein [Algoriphagus zhangzhouensis]TDY43730.1 uncharacterized protein DUF3575 [Algoriphagus zhangzhouensis]SHO64753.1 hypothetical protein SAMN04488108_3632 [Algoriphagus zhangzhouensis]